MGDYSLVERIRDAIPGKNTLLKLNELEELDLSGAVVISDTAVTRFSDEPDKLHDGILPYSGHVFINSRFVMDYRLGDKSAIASFKEALDKAFDNRNAVFERRPNFGDVPEEDYFAWSREERAAYYEVHQREAELEFLNPVALLALLKKAPLVIAPRELLPKMAAEGGLSNLAELVDEEGASVVYALPSGDNYPRVYVSRRNQPVSGPDLISRIDSETIGLILNPSSASGGLLLTSSLDSRLSAGLERVMSGIRKVRRSSHTVNSGGGEADAPDLDDYGGLLAERLSDFFGRGSFGRKEHSSGQVPFNYYGLGGKAQGFRFTGNGYEKKLVDEKRKKITEVYKSFWTIPLESIEEVHERQDFLEALVTDDGQKAAFGSLEQGLNGMFMPFIHLSSMASNLGSNLLHSRWGARIRKDDFYADFMRIAKDFVNAYEEFAAGWRAYVPNAREIVVLKSVVPSPEADNSLSRAYTFLKSIVDARPSNFTGLKARFYNELKRSGAHLMAELEGYSPENDSEVNLSKLPKKSKGKSLDHFKSSKLAALQNEFHRQNPVTQAADEVALIDLVGNKLAAYRAISDFIRENHWVRPEVVPPESGILDIRRGWYPLTDLQHTRSFVPNDTYLSPETNVEILDGINVGGKTIDMKKTFFIACLGLTGMYVPAQYARIPMFERVRFRLKDSGSGDSGAFVKELDEIDDALSAVGKSILLGVDETFTSTNPLEGEGFTYGLVRYIAEQPNSMGVFTSHYPTLHDIVDSVRGVKFAHFPFIEKKGGLEFPHKKVQGPNLVGDYALLIAQSQGIPDAIMRNAARHLSGGLSNG